MNRDVNGFADHALAPGSALHEHQTAVTKIVRSSGAPSETDLASDGVDTNQEEVQ
jgi:hypothetical protein